MKILASESSFLLANGPPNTNDTWFLSNSSLLEISCLHCYCLAAAAGVVAIITVVVVFVVFFSFGRNATDSNHWVFHLDTLHRFCFVSLFCIVPSSPSPSSSSTSSAAWVYAFFACFWCVFVLLLLFFFLFLELNDVDERMKITMQNSTMQTNNEDVDTTSITFSAQFLTNECTNYS